MTRQTLKTSFLVNPRSLTLFAFPSLFLLKRPIDTASSFQQNKQEGCYLPYLLTERTTCKDNNMTTDPQPLQASPHQEQPIKSIMDEDDHDQVGSIDPDDPLLIAQTLTYVTDNGSVVMSYSSAPFSSCTLHQ